MVDLILIDLFYICTYFLLYIILVEKNVNLRLFVGNEKSFSTRNALNQGHNITKYGQKFPRAYKLCTSFTDEVVRAIYYLNVKTYFIYQIFLCNNKSTAQVYRHLSSNLS